MTGQYRGLYDRCPECQQLQLDFIQGEGYICRSCGYTTIRPRT